MQVARAQVLFALGFFWCMNPQRIKKSIRRGSYLWITESRTEAPIWPDSRRSNSIPATGSDNPKKIQAGF